MMLSIDERIKVIKDSKVYFKFCFRFLTIGATSNSYDKGKHIPGNGKNGSCAITECENNVTLCKKHKAVNRDRHRLYKNALRWAQGARPAQNDGTIQEESYLMAMTEETESKGIAEMSGMSNT